VFVAWTNFLARAKHGEMQEWDYWTENGSPSAIATSGAEPKPSSGGLDHSNIKPDNNSPLLEDTQRPMQDDAYGVLEIFVDPTGKDVIDAPGYRMRLDNVGPKVREEYAARCLPTDLNERTVDTIERATAAVGDGERCP
jgi:hypothetical protein